MSPPRRRPPPQTFEAAFQELQRVVDQLESGGPDLEAALALVDDGARLAATCNQLLGSAELRVTRLTPESATPIPDASTET